MAPKILHNSIENFRYQRTLNLNLFESLNDFEDKSLNDSVFFKDKAKLYSTKFSTFEAEIQR